jgi:glycosyltransferase involved in cell wall biosynthesis
MLSQGKYSPPSTGGCGRPINADDKPCSGVARIGVLSAVMGKANIAPFMHLVQIMKAISGSLTVIRVTDSDAFPVLSDVVEESEPSAIDLVHDVECNPILSNLATQMRICWKLAKLSRQVDMWFFYQGDAMFLPMLVAKALKKKVVFLMGGSLVHQVGFGSGMLLLLKSLRRAALELCDCLVLYSKYHIREWGLQRYETKTLIAPNHFIDFDEFRMINRVQERDCIVAYVGRYSPEKGVTQFVESIPMALSLRQDLRFVISGEGYLRSEIEEFVRTHNLNEVTRVTGWVPHDELPQMLNEVRLLVMPSLNEGLPSLMLEAMACGTLVLGTPVGAMREILEDGGNGFVIRDRDPDMLGTRIADVINHSDNDELVFKAISYVHHEFSFDMAIKRYDKVVRVLMQDSSSAKPWIQARDKRSND